MERVEQVRVNDDRPAILKEQIRGKLADKIQVPVTALLNPL